MSIIAVHGFPMKFSQLDVIKILAKPIGGNFEALNFITPKGQEVVNKNKALRTCFIRLSSKLDPLSVVQRINSYRFNTKLQYKAHIPLGVPDSILRAKPKSLTPRLRRILRIPEELTEAQMMQFSMEELLMELQVKYPGLYELSKRHDHRLLQELAKILYSRVQEMVIEWKPIRSCIELTFTYRKMYPYEGDFNLVLSTHHAVQDAVGEPRDQLEEAHLTYQAHPPLSLEMSEKQLRQLRNKCGDKIIATLSEHIKGLDSDIKSTDNENQIARKQVRLELKKMSPFLGTIVNQIMDKHFMPQDGPLYRMRMYGDPRLPGRETILSFLSQFKIHKVTNSPRMFNLVKFLVHPAKYHNLIAMNGAELGGCKLIIRSSDMAEYKGVGNALSADSNEIEEEGADQEPMDEDDEEEYEDDEQWEEQALEM